jgi:CrcB protein
MKTEWQFLFVALGGALGAISRFGISQYFSSASKSGFPIGTLVANVCGCFLIGMLVGSGAHEKSEAARVGFGVGFLGALTTFSTFGAETINHANDGQFVHAIGNVSANLILGLLAVMIGMAAGRKLFG